MRDRHNHTIPRGPLSRADGGLRRSRAARVVQGVAPWGTVERPHSRGMVRGQWEPVETGTMLLLDGLWVDEMWRLMGVAVRALDRLEDGMLLRGCAESLVGVRAALAGVERCSWWFAVERPAGGGRARVAFERAYGRLA